MAGHSKWANIKHKKAATDAKKAKLWSKLSKAIMVAAKNGGSDLDSNIRLRTVVNDARAVSMPKENIERAIKKGAGELESVSFEEIVYEGYGPGGVAVMCDILTDNRNRTAPEVRKLFEKHGGKMGATGCVGYLFDRKGLVLIPADQVSEERVMEVALEAGADDVVRSDDHFEVTCDPEVFSGLTDALDAANIVCASREVTRIPQNTVDVGGEEAVQLLALMDALDDHDDVQGVSANLNLSDETLAAIGGE